MSQSFTTRPEIRGTFGAVTSTHWLASAVGFGILEKGGNAFDAAVATGFTLQIVEPHLNGPGGEVPILIHAAGTDRPRVLCGQGVAPAAATTGAVRDMGFTRMPGMGLIPAVIPGAFDAWMRLLLEHGTMTLREVLSPAIGYAQNGYPLVQRAAESVHASAELFQTEWHHSAEVWIPNGKKPMPGDKVAQPQIAATYERLLSEAEASSPDRETQIEAARRIWYQGFIADAVDSFYRTEQYDGEGGYQTGLLTGQDMATWQSTWEDTTSATFQGVEVHKTGPWGQGPALLMALKLLETRGIADVQPGSAEWVHLSVEALKIALAHRDAYFGDPDHVDVPLDTILSPDHITAQSAAITDLAQLDLPTGKLPGDDIDRATLLKELAADPDDPANSVGEPTFADLPEIEGDTCHLDVVDRWGNLVSATPSGGWLQSAPAVPGLGFNITTRGQMYWLDERMPSALAPGRRPRTTLTPTIITRDGKPILGLGSPGGDQQDQWALGLILRHLVQGLGIQAAIDAPLFHSGHYIYSFAPRTYTPNVLHIEDRFETAILNDLRARGHILNVQPAWALGRLCAAGYTRSGMIRAAATPRFMQAYAVGR